MYNLRLIFFALVSAQVLVNLGESVYLVRFNISKKAYPQNGPQNQPLISYYANIGVGTPLKDFKMLVDINSQQNWLPHYSQFGLLFSRLNYKDGYAKKYSSSSVKGDIVYNFVYHGTELSGKIYEDVFELRNVTESSESPRLRQSFFAVSSASNDHFSRRGVDGLISINPLPVSETGSLFSDLIRANPMVKLIVGLSLEQDQDSEYGGELTLGGVNPTKFVDSLTSHYSFDQVEWQLNLNGVMLGHETIGCANDKCIALISTTANDIYGPPEQVKKVLKYFGHQNVDEKFDENQLYDIDCLEVAKAPSITFIIDDVPYTLHPLAYIRKRTEGILFKEEKCYIAILSSGSKNQWELGTNFLSNYYTIFDLISRRLAFAQRTQC